MNKLVYCNNCFSQPSRTLMFYVTTCAHVYCQTCKEDCTRSSCKMCGATCSTAALSQNMSQDVRELFKDPKHTLQRAMMIGEFQVTTLKANYKKATELGIKYKQQADSLRKENVALKNELSKLKDQQSTGIDITQSPTFLARPDYPSLPAFEQPTASQSSSAFGMHTPSNRSQKKYAVVTGYTPSRQAAGMMADMDISHQRSQRAYDDDVQPRGHSIVGAVTPPFRFSPANAGHRRSIPGSDSSLSSSCFRTPSTDSLSRYNTGIPAIVPLDISDSMYLMPALRSTMLV
ncbi:hypothetical protein MTO96_009584 [Rhipicephalus appendiculatus]